MNKKITMADVPALADGTYQHWSEALYDVEGVAYSDVGKWLVVLRSHETGVLHAESIEQFRDVVTVGSAGSVERFAKCEDVRGARSAASILHDVRAALMEYRVAKVDTPDEELAESVHTLGRCDAETHAEMKRRGEEIKELRAEITRLKESK